MAEERILIGTDIESPCVKCKEIDFCEGNCEQYEKFAKEFKPGALKVLSRQEAIEKLARALCGDDVIREGYYQMAETGLNALLEDK